ncbi:uncharacterized protein DUF2848 [Melghirimyces profundicolus]|uniref:Uncharacterized protein DUF2848 n=1 Tax=Melghirimyces profundicolus TaxID=1242148 RepID=A0A2T6BD02_9BACL|nr:DUF2848 domain-containing protein [Melghirimyces profundicolus]PTX53950.1 uncharacterized protein DUF2848 [Melghirimyces profundicolus]
MKNRLKLNVQGTEKTIEVTVNRVFNAGYAGSDQTKVQEHIDELAKLGVPVPSTTPTLYPISNYLPTVADRVQVQHGETSGEIEYVLIWAEGELFVTVGSDHTDRKLETYSVPMSKQAYPNVIADQVWRFKDVKDHWDRLELECWVTANGERVLYQKGTCADLMPPSQWKEIFRQKNVAKEGNLFFSATINTVANTLAFADRYEFEMRDPVLDRVIRHQYEVDVLAKPIE